MKLKIDDIPCVDQIKFVTLQRDYAHTVSPRSIVQQRGLEFDHFRPYQISDDASMIDWKASARSTETLVRVYSEDVSMNILLMLDVSETMIYGTGNKAKVEFALELVLNLAYGILNFGDRVGLIVHNDEVINTAPFASELEQYYIIKQLLTDYSKFGGNAKISKPLSWVIETFRDTHLLIMVSDFLGFGDDFFNQLYSVLDHFDILGVMVNDKTDLELDKSLFYLDAKDPFAKQRGVISTYNAVDKYRKANQERINKIKDFFYHAKKDLWVMNTDDDIRNKLPKFVEERNMMK